MQDLALDYYSKSLRGLSHALSRPSLAHLVEDDGFLMSTMFLYLHGVGLILLPWSPITDDHCSSV